MTYNFPTATWIGFDNVFRHLEDISKSMPKIPTYPPFNVRKIDEDHYSIEIAIAGFAKEDIDVTTKGNELVVTAKLKEDNSDYIHKGIATRAFERQFTLADTIKVGNAQYVNGLLKIMLEQVIPDEQKPKKVQVE